MWDSDRYRNRRKKEKTKRVRDFSKRYHHMESCLFFFTLVCSVLRIPKCSGSTWRYSFSGPGSHYPWGIDAVPITWNGHVCKELFPFSQFAMVGIFVWIGYSDVPQQAWHLPVVSICTLPIFAQWNLSSVLIPNLHLHLGAVLMPPYLPSVLFLSFCCGGLFYEIFLWQCLRQFIVLLKSLHPNPCRGRVFPAGLKVGFIRLLVNDSSWFESWYVWSRCSVPIWY